MALVDKTKIVRIELPHEPGGWIELHPMSSGDLANLPDDPYAAMLKMLQRIVTTWSYDVPVTPDNVLLLDVETVNELAVHVRAMSGVKTDAEKNDSSSPSSDITP